MKPYVTRETRIIAFYGGSEQKDGAAQGGGSPKPED